MSNNNNKDDSELQSRTHYYNPDRTAIPVKDDVDQLDKFGSPKLSANDHSFTNTDSVTSEDRPFSSPVSTLTSNSANFSDSSLQNSPVHPIPSPALSPTLNLGSRPDVKRVSSGGYFALPKQLTSIRQTHRPMSQQHRVPSFHPASDTAPPSPIPFHHHLRKKGSSMSIPGQTSIVSSNNGSEATNPPEEKLAIIMVGLPARGKSYIVNKLVRYYNWLQYNCKAFNVGNFRRKHASHSHDDASFFDPSNEEASKLRESFAMDTLDALLQWFEEEDGVVGIFDATNSTSKRRKAIVDHLSKVPYVTTLFIESICNDEQLIAANMRMKLVGPDYKDLNPEQSLRDFQERVRMYERKYEPLGKSEEDLNLRYIKVINVGKKVVAFNIRGFLAGQAVFFLLNFNLSPRQIWVTRHGESVDNVRGRIGGNAELTPLGRQFSEDLALFIDEKRDEFQERLYNDYSKESHLLQHGSHSFNGKQFETSFNCLTPSENTVNDPQVLDPEDEERLEKPYSVWTSMMQRSIQTAAYFDEEQYDIKAMRMLNEICSGICDGLTYEEIKSIYPKEYEARKLDKLNYRYPGSGGESYLDVIYRLQSVIVEIERMKHHVLVIGHRVITRIIIAYFLGCRREDIAYLNVPLHTVYCIEPQPYGTDFYQYNYDPNTRKFSRVPFSL
ncbi:putative 6-phosphofructo-2-kinase PB17E12.14c [Schizosaccharomyces pombe]|uniref:Probable 6-phosphofructo-2-kinase PB17E12.14c n=1 Tax=Schizosaccharomyces pombe (strain 972 / ATCC 24843) TaxID=284812 RepID=YIKE_SCHPO|nr:putative 6-phosphofructo-2-kinase [Schizosaccharomyces pombe]Q8TFH0.2 RecName: Full=Probable 6-phosphofructo-2-kinase PB17E12.14c [Schizosaccharomyces pombe 972h-]CAD27507.2 6-phosphofructo-2-kinase (predicted) [Schizosaccharomyces pombe]|eukprot:NP_001018229.2 putative 6-phosphofructo-2-kinase [Schizosaccharomyces pombe]